MRRVLIVDDSTAIQKLVAGHVQEAGGQVVAMGRDGNEGVALYRQHLPDLVILDITMPNRDGRDCLREILSINPRAIVIMLSSISCQNVIKECLQIGAISFVNKSGGITNGSLKAEIARYVQLPAEAADRK
jgi:two-component system chemotaxis response regulator CheY